MTEISSKENNKIVSEISDKKVKGIISEEILKVSDKKSVAMLSIKVEPIDETDSDKRNINLTKSLKDIKENLDMENNSRSESRDKVHELSLKTVKIDEDYSPINGEFGILRELKNLKFEDLSILSDYSPSTYREDFPMEYMWKNENHINSKFYPAKIKMFKDDSNANTPSSKLDISTFSTFLESNPMRRYFGNNINKGEDTPKIETKGLTNPLKFIKKNEINFTSYKEEFEYEQEDTQESKLKQNSSKQIDSSKVQNAYINMNVNMNVVNNTNPETQNPFNYGNYNNNNKKSNTQNSYKQIPEKVNEFNENMNNTYSSHNDYNDYNNYNNYKDENISMNLYRNNNNNFNFYENQNQINNVNNNYNNNNFNEFYGEMYLNNMKFPNFQIMNNRNQNPHNNSNNHFNNSHSNQQYNMTPFSNNSNTPQYHKKSSLNNIPNMNSNMNSNINEFTVREFKNNIKPQKTTLISFMNMDDLELVKHSYYLAKDQAGCRYLQKKIDENPEIVNSIYPRIVEHIIELMNDAFGNYLIQKIVEHISDDKFYQILAIVKIKY